MKKIILLSIVLTAVLLASCAGSDDETPLKDNDIIPVKVTDLVKEDVQKTIVSAGRFTTDDEAYLSFKTGGIIEKIFVKEGDAVKKGELLATLNLGEINAMVAQAKAGYEKAKRDYNRVSNLYRDSVATLEQLQNAKTGMEVAEKQLSIAEFNSNYSEIRALSDGYVLKKFANEGQMVASGSPVIQTNGEYL